VEGGGEGHTTGEMIFKILIPRVFAFFIFYFDLKFHFIHFHVVRFLVQDERKKVKKKKKFLKKIKNYWIANQASQ